MYTLTLMDEIVAVLEISKPTHHSFDPLWMVRTTLEEEVVELEEEAAVDAVAEAMVAVEAEEDVAAVLEANNDVSKKSKFSLSSHCFLLFSPLLSSILPSPSTPPLPGRYLQHEIVGTVEDMKPAELDA